MNARLVVAVALTMIVASSVAFADTYGYFFYYVNNGGEKVVFSGTQDASRGLDSNDKLYTGSFSTTGIHVTIYKQTGVYGWDVANAFLVQETRPALQAGEVDVLGDIYLWAGTATTPQSLQFPSDYYHLGFAPGMTYTLRLVQIPTGITYTGPTEWGLNHDTISLPFFATDDFSKGYKFQAVVTAPVPEPSSALALGGGIIGLGGDALRRMKA